MEKIYEILEQMKKRPAMYLGKKSIILLEAFINGYLDREKEIDNNYIPSFSYFANYVKEYYDNQISNSWAKIILFYSADDEEAFDIFYNILDDFKEKIRSR